ncbi:MAG: hypothetical protein CM1200mP2_39960 [Planctomycetaceae bacterium]|nr:MAG: hypothetical protein CM1200mP2_39960 [Planctomycetaceae bacterium]
MTPGKRSGCSCIAAGASSGTLSSSPGVHEFLGDHHRFGCRTSRGSGQSGFQRVEKRARRSGRGAESLVRRPWTEAPIRSTRCWTTPIRLSSSLRPIRQRLARSSSIVSRRASTSLRVRPVGHCPGERAARGVREPGPEATCGLSGIRATGNGPGPETLLVMGQTLPSSARTDRHGRDRRVVTVTGDERGAISLAAACTVAVTRHPITKSGRIMATVSSVSRLPGWRSQRDPRARTRSRSLVGRLSMAGQKAGR